MDNQYSSNMYSEAQNCWQQQQQGTGWSYPASGNQPLSKPPGDDIMNIVMSRRLGGQASVSTGSMDTGFRGNMDTAASGNMDSSFMNSMDSAATTGSMDSGFRGNMDTASTGNMDTGFSTPGNQIYNTTYGNYSNNSGNTVNVNASGASVMNCGLGTQMSPAMSIPGTQMSPAMSIPGTQISPAMSIPGTQISPAMSIPNNMGDGYGRGQEDSYNGHFANCDTAAVNNVAGVGYREAGMFTDRGGVNLGAFRNENSEHYNGNYIGDCSNNPESSSVGYHSSNTGMFTAADVSQRNVDMFYGGNQGNADWNKVQDECGPPASKRLKTEDLAEHRYDELDGFPSYSGDSKKQDDNIPKMIKDEQLDVDLGEKRKPEESTDCPPPSSVVNSTFSIGGFESLNSSNKTDEKSDNITTGDGAKISCSFSPVTDQGAKISRSFSPVSDQGANISRSFSPVSDQGAKISRSFSPVSDQGANISRSFSPVSDQGANISRSFSPVSDQGANISRSFSPVSDQGANISRSFSPVTDQGAKISRSFSPVSDQGSEENAASSQCFSAPETETVADIPDIRKASDGSLQDESKCDADDAATSDGTSAKNRSELDTKEHSFLDLFKRSDNKNSSGHDKLEDMFLKRHEEHIKLRERSDGSVDSSGETDDNSGLGASTDRSMTQSPVVSDSADGKYSTQKEDGKKSSRKQNAPKRVVKAVGDGGITPINESENVNNESQDSEQKSKPEKSRKQFKPQRIVPAFDKFEDVADPPVTETGHPVTDKEGVDTQNEEEEENYYSCLEKERSESLPSKIPPHLAALYQYGSPLNYPPKDVAGTSPYLGLAGTKLSPSSWQSKLLADFRNNVIKSQASSPELTPAVQSDDLKENIEVVRKLREIRFNRYRKITIAEKKEIAAYAKVHSVSAAANRYSVSKSAVSMWTRMDFSNVSDDSERKKKYSVLENEKFEELVHRVKEERAHKFKGLSKEEKSEVSKYAKLVGVREMSRCLDIALGTVSGWMRQFPYKPSNQEDENKEASGSSSNSQVDIEKTDEALKTNGDNDVKIPDSSNKQMTEVNKTNDSTVTEPATQNAIKESVKEDVRGSVLHSSKSGTNFALDNSKFVDIKIKTEPVAVQEASEESTSKYFEGKEVNESSNDTNDGYFTQDERLKLKQENDMSSHGKYDSNKTDTDEKIADSHEVKSEIVDEVKNGKLDAMLADTLKEPNVEQCYADIKEMIAGTPLDGDIFFEELFGRVLKCRADKYKSLKASDKLEVVRYAKRNGVRRIAKVMGLATGTLSGWNLRYQAHLGLTADNVDNVRKESFKGTDSLNTSTTSNTESCPDTESSPSLSDSFGNTEVSNTQSPSMMAKMPKKQSSSVLDNLEKSEVIAIKLLLKDRYQFLLDKIDIARKIKFRNVSPYEKIEIVKCAKLVGIRPTARVLKMPIGTLSGWIAKYASELHPAYHSEGHDSPETPQKFVPTIPGIAGDLSKIGSPMGTPVRGGIVPSWMGLMNSFNASLMNVAATVALRGPMSLPHLGMPGVDGSAPENINELSHSGMPGVDDGSSENINELSHSGMPGVDDGSSENINELDDKVRVLNYSKDFGTELDSGNGLSNEGNSSTSSPQIEIQRNEDKLQHVDEDKLERVVDERGGGAHEGENDGAEVAPVDGDDDTKLMVQKYLQSAYAQLGIS